MSRTRLIKMTSRLYQTWLTHGRSFLCRRFGEDPDCPGEFEIGDSIISKATGRNAYQTYYHEACWGRLFL